ncbi:unnamed protein product [Adineta steineri]|uniref:Uncharacterized protein n=1 Tax=Adineta steineri TaxID=433720 RepID=A0A814CTC4_9BILA|nr:unnamed protein product [Adineta steineri]
MAIPNIVRSWLYQGFQIPSILFGVVILYYLLMDRALRNALNNHVIIAMVSVGLILQFFDVTALTYITRTGTELVSTKAFCLAWVSIRSIGFPGVINLVAWASIERHILIFHANLVRTKTKRFFFSLSSVGHLHDDSWPYCGYYSCVTVNPSVAFVALIIRVLVSKCRARQRIQWRNYRKMAIQLLSISFLYIVLYCPPIFLYVAYLAGLKQIAAISYYSDSNYFGYYAITLTPFICALSLPELRMKFKICFPCCRRRRPAIGPQALMMTRPTAGPTAAIAAIAQ